MGCCVVLLVALGNCVRGWRGGGGGVVCGGAAGKGWVICGSVNSSCDWTPAGSIPSHRPKRPSAAEF